MATLTFAQKQQIILTNPNRVLVKEAQKRNTKFMLHTHGTGLKKAIERQDYFENADIYKSRQELAISNKDMLARTLQEEDQVFTARGGSVHFNIGDNQEAQMVGLLDNVAYGMDLHQWVRTFGLQAYRNDPMGVFLLEIEQVQLADGVAMVEPRCYPTYKSVQSIYDYQPNGRKLEYICFQLSVQQLLAFGITDNNYTLRPEDGKVVPENKVTPYFRIIDDAVDVIVKLDNQTISVVTNITQPNPIPNPWKKVPGFIASDLICFDEPSSFASPLEFVIELCDVFLTDRSIRDLQKKYHGFAKAIEPMLQCSSCEGEGMVKGNACPECTPPGKNKGTGYKLRTKVSEVAKFPMEIFEQIPNFDFRTIFGYVTPDIDSWKQQDLSLDQLEQLVYFTYWGVARQMQQQSAAPTKTGDKTAYEVRANLKPKYARLNATADWAERTENMIADLIGLFWMDAYKPGTSPISYGRNYILETPADLRQEYFDLRANGSPDFLLDEAMIRYLTSEYESSPMQLAKYKKLLLVEPFPHIELADAKGLIPIEDDYNAKVYFGEWYSTLPDAYIVAPSNTPEKLRLELKAYVTAKNIPPTPAPMVPGSPLPGQKGEQDAEGAAARRAVAGTQ